MECNIMAFARIRFKRNNLLLVDIATHSADGVDRDKGCEIGGIATHKDFELTIGIVGFDAATHLQSTHLVRELRSDDIGTRLIAHICLMAIVVWVGVAR